MKKVLNIVHTVHDDMTLPAGFRVMYTDGTSRNYRTWKTLPARLRDIWHCELNRDQYPEYDTAILSSGEDFTTWAVVLRA